jgi:hypothetical protein
MGDIVLSRSTDGRRVAEVDLEDTTTPVAELVDEARRRGAELVWAHGGRPDVAGFVELPGYAHLHAENPVAGRPLPPIGADAYGPLLARAYLGQWGHKWVDPDRPLPTDGSVVLGLSEEREPVGLCRVWPEQRVVDQPGVVPERRGAARTVRLLGAACALLGPGAVDVDSWGEAPEILEACASLGFAVTERQQGWELRL